MQKSWIHNGTILIRIGKHHLAFLRAYLEGLDLKEISARYLETAVEDDHDLRIAKSTLTWIRDQLMVVAKRSKKIPNPRVILINPEKLTVIQQKHLPTLEEFREERDPYEMYGEAELTEMFLEEFGGVTGRVDRKSQRNERLRKKQIDALFYFEQLLGVNPALNDSLHGWIDPALANRLNKASIFEIGELIVHINANGYRWWRLIPRLGEKAASQIVAWLNTETIQSSIKIRVGKRSLVKSSELKSLAPSEIRAKQFGIVPIEYLHIPEHFTGQNGTNRNEKNWLNCANDYEAIHKWLEIKTKTGSNTWRNYRKEAERLLLWCLIEKGKPLSSLDVSDCSLYITFLENLDSSTPPSSADWPFTLPSKAWTAPRYLERSDPAWKPFEGKLSTQSIHQAQIIVRSLFSWLLKVGYLQHNPWEGVPNPKKEIRLRTSRVFTFYEWNYVLNHLENQMRDEKYDRLRFVLIFLHGTGLRLSEIVNAQIKDIERVHTVHQTMSPDYELKVIGKGNIERKVTLSDKCLNELERYLNRRGLGNRFKCPAETFLVGRFRTTKGRKSSKVTDIDQVTTIESLDPTNLKESALYQALKAYFKSVVVPIEAEADAADMDQKFEMANGLRDMAKRIKSASTHWLRHTCATHFLANGVSIPTVQSNLGHKSVATTTIYLNPQSSVKNAEINNAMDLMYSKP